MSLKKTFWKIFSNPPGANELTWVKYSTEKKSRKYVTDIENRDFCNKVQSKAVNPESHATVFIIMLIMKQYHHKITKHDKYVICTWHCSSLSLNIFVWRLKLDLNKLFLSMSISIFLQRHTHTHKYIYIYTCACVCVCVGHCTHTHTHMGTLVLNVRYIGKIKNLLVPNYHTCSIFSECQGSMSCNILQLN